MSAAVVGRQKELDAVAQFLEGVKRGPAALIVEGEAGIGKTTVWTAALARARALSFVVLSARPVEAEARLAFAALADLFEPVVEDVLPQLPEPQRHALAVALLREDPGVRRLDRRAVSAAALSVLRALAATRPVIVAVDDLHWLDLASARALDFASRRLGRLPVGLLTCERTDDIRRIPLELERAFPEGALTRLRLGPLSVAALHHLIKARLGRSWPRRTLLRIARVSGGNPFFALEIARLLPADISPTLAELPLPENLRDLVAARIAGLSRRAREALLAAAALRSPTLDLVAAATSATPAASSRSFEPAVAAGIVEIEDSGIRFAHPLFAAGVYSSASPLDRRRVHRRLAERVEGVEEKARHLALAADGADERLASILDAAAEHARCRGAPETAAELAEHARLLTPPHDVGEIQRRTIQAAEYEFHAGELRRAREALEAVLEQEPAGRLRADGLRLLGEISFYESSFPAAIAAFEEALEFAGDDAALRSKIEIHLAFAANAAVDFAAARAHALRGLELAEPLGVEGGVAEALAVAAMTNYLLGGGLDEGMVQRALELEDADRQVTAEMRPSLVAGYLMLYEGRLEESVRILGTLRERMLDRGQESDLVFVSTYMAWAESWRGDLRVAAAYGEESLECAARTGGEPLRCWSLAFAAIPPAYAGDSRLATERAGASIEIANRVGFHIVRLWAGWALALVALSKGDPQAAEAALAPFLPMFEEQAMPDPIVGFFLPDAMEALISIGQLERAENLLERFEEAARRLSRGWALAAAGRCRALLLAARGDLEGAAAAAREAVGVGESLALRLELARTLLVAGEIARRRRQKRLTREYLERALALFEEMGARAWAGRARATLARTTLRRAEADELTESERCVAELAASGRTNRDVAAALFMSPKTVEATLARVYRKLGIHSRAELGARLAGSAREAPRA